MLMFFFHYNPFLVPSWLGEEVEGEQIQQAVENMLPGKEAKKGPVL